MVTVSIAFCCLLGRVGSNVKNRNNFLLFISMLSKDQVTKISKRLSYVLRHNPASIGVKLDENGWAPVNELLANLKIDGLAVDFGVLKYVVETNNKNRFRFNEDLTKIRASQGHSVKVDLSYIETIPPDVLFHGTAEKFLQAILKTGLRKMNRHHVHLSADVETALQVGKRHGKPVVLTIDAAEMYEAAYRFYLSDNLVWLTDAVPARFIKITDPFT